MNKPFKNTSDDRECPLCGSVENIHLFHSNLRYAYPAKIYSCSCCSFIFIHPRPLQEELSVYYSTNYRDDYEDAPVEDRHISDTPEAKTRLYRLKKEHPTASTLLEIGSGSGAFLSLAHNSYNYAAGIELDLSSRTFLLSKKLNVFSDISNLEKKKFDIIVLFHVLEHLDDPSEYLKNLSNYLNKNGKIFIEVPNIEDALISIYNLSEFKDFYFCSAHLSYFSEKTLMECAQRSDMIGTIEHLQRYDLNNHLHWLEHKTPEKIESEKKILSETVLSSYAEELKSRKSGDTLWGIFQTISQKEL